jgi:benzoyl-CoA reductase/2-hydroxyglutaryl-CoA dehydratase subunit BcrC/BadD/HgdB
MSIFNEIREIAESTSNKHLIDAQKAGKKIVGYLCSHVPEEMIHAAGAIPYRMRAIESQGTTHGDTFYSSANCSFVRRVLDKGMQKDFDFLHGIVFMNGCDHSRRLFDNWRHASIDSGFNYMLVVPYARTESAHAQFTFEINKFKKFLEDHFNIELTDEKLKISTELYNRKRTLLKQIAQTRKATNPPISGTEFLSLMLAIVVLPVETAIDYLEKVLIEIENGKQFEPKGELRLFVTGSCLEELSHLELLEDSGAVVVADAICLGSRYFEVNIETDGETLPAITKRYLKKLSCPRMMDDYKGRMAYAKAIVKEYNIDAVIVEKLEFCSMMSGESYIYRHEMKDADIPSITLTRELYGGGIGQLKTRIQAFYEKVINKK